MTCFSYIYPIVPWDLKTYILERVGGKILGIDHHPVAWCHKAMRSRWKDLRANVHSVYVKRY